MNTLSHMVANSLKDLVARTETIGLVTDLVNLDHVRSMLKAISARKCFQVLLQQAQGATSDHGTITDLLASPRSFSSLSRRSRNHRRRGRAVYTAPAAREQPRHRLRQTSICWFQLGRARNPNAERPLRRSVVGFVAQQQ